MLKLVNSIGYIAPSNSGIAGYTAIREGSTRQYCEEYGRYSPVLRVREALLHMNACREKPIMMNRQVLCSWSLSVMVTLWYRYCQQVENRNVSAPTVGVFPFSLSSDSKELQRTSCTTTPYPIQRNHYYHYANRYIGTQVFILSRYQYSMYSSNSRNCADFLSTDKIPRQARPVEQIKHHYYSPEKCTDNGFSSASCRISQDPSREHNYCLMYCIRLGRTGVCIMPITSK